jgi:hypothetical protein
VKQKENIFEELNKMKNLIHARPGVVISEQANPSADAGIIMRELGNVNSDEAKIVNILKNYKDKASFKNFVDQYKTISGKDFGADVFRAIQPYNDKTEWDDLKNHLKTLGVSLIHQVRDNRQGGSYAIFGGLNTPAAAATNTDDAWKTTYSCVPSQPGATPAKLSNGSTAYLVGQIYYYANGRKKLADGTMGSYSCSTEFKSGTANSGSGSGSGSRQSSSSVNTRFADSAKSLGVENAKMDVATLQTMLKSLQGETSTDTPTQGTPDIATLTAALNQLKQ